MAAVASLVNGWASQRAPEGSSGRWAQCCGPQSAEHAQDQLGEMGKPQLARTRVLKVPEEGGYSPQFLISLLTGIG